MQLLGVGGLILLLIGVAAATFILLYVAKERGAGKAGRLMARAVQLREQDGDEQEIEALMREAIVTEQRRGGSDLTLFINNLAVFYESQGRVDEATPLYQRVLDLDKEQHGEEALELLPAHANLGANLVALGEYEEAEPHLIHALALAEAYEVMAEPVFDVSSIMHSLATAYLETENYNAAEPLLRRAIALDEALYGHGEPRVAAGLSELAWALTYMDRAPEAEQLMRRALSIEEDSFGATSLEVASRLMDLAQIIQMQNNRTGEARAQLLKALGVVETGPLQSSPDAMMLRDEMRTHLAQMGAPSV